MDKISPLFYGFGDGCRRQMDSESSDGVVKVDLRFPQGHEQAGKPGTATPEHSFAVGYAACFGGAGGISWPAAKEGAPRRGEDRVQRVDRPA